MVPTISVHLRYQARYRIAARSRDKAVGDELGDLLKGFFDRVDAITNRIETAREGW